MDPEREREGSEEGDASEVDPIIINLKKICGPDLEALVNPTATVEELKEAIMEQHEIPPDQQRLVFRGRVLQDEKTLTELGIKEGSSLHLVVSKKKESTPTPVVPRPPSDTVSIPMLGNVNTASLQAMANSPMFQTLMDRPELMRDMMLAANPRFARAMERNPQLAQVMNDPATLRTALQTMSNPAAMQQMARSFDLQVSQIENIPGGAARLQSMMQDLTGQGNEDGEEERPSLQQPQPPMPWNPTSQTSGSGTAGGQGDMQPLFQQMMSNPQFMEMMQNMMAGGSFQSQQQPSGDPAVLYAVQLDQLQALGFPNREANLAALQASGGNIDLALNRLLGEQ
eukprot:Sspe_Gene.89948::Locus_61603_Transcript_5_6_Confidence_0.222_Length_1291::g.89948::m.89948/K04523/UBQLN, DSK2; ubiquilin